MVETTLDLPIEAAAEQRREGHHRALRPRQGVQQAALVALDGQGRVRAMSAAPTTPSSQFDRAVDAQRQAGSSWKPFVYLTAMEAGRTPDTPVVDEPVTIDGWSPQQLRADTTSGRSPCRTALAQSINTVAASLADEVGRPNVAATARRLGHHHADQHRSGDGAGHAAW